MRLELRGETWARVQRRVTSVWAGNASRLAWDLEGWSEFGRTKRNWREFWKQNKLTENTGRQTQGD